MASTRTLPALFLSCRDGRPAVSRPAPLISRLVEPGTAVEAVVFITMDHAEPGARLSGGPAGSERLQSLARLLAGQGLVVQIERLPGPALADVAAELCEPTLDECIELCLSRDLGARRCRQIGQALSTWREDNVLLVCLDRVRDEARADGLRPLHDPYWRGLMSHWVEQQQWRQAMSGSAELAFDPSQDEDDGTDTLCLLQAAFGLGGQHMPERLFGFDLDDTCLALSGYGWMN
ncbi:hypothetical protein CK507_05780 [Pseudomonas sp. WN033]|nr:hypothetical protein CK507_05780 [Pseudomonas sp. WN033]